MLDEFLIEAHPIRQEQIAKGALVLVVTVSLDGDILPKDEVRGGVLGIVAKGLAFLRAVDATETDAFRALVVQNFESVAVKDSDDGAGEVGGESRDRP